MKILLTGANGQIGTEILTQKNIDLEFVATNSKQLDIENWEQVKKVLKKVNPEVVINTAAFTAVDDAETEPEKAYAANEIGAKNLALECTRINCPLIHISTDFVFDGKKVNPYKEDDPTNPLNTYGKSKLAGEIAIRDNCSDHIILRTAWVFSPWRKNFMKSILNMLNENQPLNIIGDQKGSPTAASDIAKTVVKICRQINRSGESQFGTFHFCGKGNTSWFGFAKQIGKIWKQFTGKEINIKEILTSEYPAIANRPLNSSLDCEKLEEIFGIKTVNWESAVDREVRRYLSMGNKG
ncbi:MAG: dTDP-4-dehydrorhamnose reductase [Pseudomonadota bacterium]|nr:dTDP-4-dehydrorhamnose reductase [Pseudomonadota bacterium]